MIQRALLWMCGLSVLGGACAASTRSFRASDRQAIRQVLDAQREAWNRGDIEAYMDGYARDEQLIFTSGGQIRRGWNETLERYQRRYGADSSTMGTLSFEILEVQAVGADGAVVLGRWRLDGLPAAAGGVFSVVLERRREGWRIVHDHTSSEPVAEEGA